MCVCVHMCTFNHPSIVPTTFSYFPHSLYNFFPTSIDLSNFSHSFPTSMILSNHIHSEKKVSTVSPPPLSNLFENFPTSTVTIQLHLYFTTSARTSARTFQLYSFQFHVQLLVFSNCPFQLHVSRF